MASSGQGQLNNFATGPGSDSQTEEVKNAPTPTMSIPTVATPITPEAFLASVSLPQSYCFTQPTLTSSALNTASHSQITPSSPSPLNMIGFPLNQLTNQFVQSIPINQITSTMQGFPINPAILTMATNGQGQFLQGGNQFPPLIMNPQQPIMTNALIGSLANTINSVTPLTIQSNALPLPSSESSATDINSVTENNPEMNQITEVSTVSEMAPVMEPVLIEEISEVNNETHTDNSENPIMDSISLPETGTLTAENLPQSMNDSSNDSEVGFLTEDTKLEFIDQPEKFPEENANPLEQFGAEPLSFQDDADVNSEIMRRYRRNLNSKKKKSQKEMIIEEEKEDQIKKEYLSDDGVDREMRLEKRAFPSIDIGDYNEDGVPIEYDEPEFVWEEYLQETGASAVPPTAFKHVECSLQSGFVKGMKLEVPNKSSSGTYWVASVIMTCGQLLRLRYDGYEEDGSADFWCDLMTSEIHPIGWCSENNQTLQPPEAISDKVSDWKEFLMNSLTGARTAPSYLLDKTTGTTPIDQIKQGMKLEIQDSIYPYHVWLVRIIENAGGRLYLRYEGVESGSLDFWLFYLDVRLHPVGWGNQNNYIYKPPRCVEKADYRCEDLQKALEVALEEAKQQVLPIDVFKDQRDIIPHEFELGMKLEALHPVTRNQICPATVAEVVDKNFFIVQIDDLTTDDDSKKIRFSAYSNMSTIFPIHWCQWKGIRICSPRGWNKPEFNWSEYLNDFDAKPVPESCFSLINEEDDEDYEFERGMKLEAVNRDNPNQICAATITKIVGHLMWIHLDNSNKMVASHVEDVYSHNLFPVGWCESNGYQLKPPRKTGLKQSTVKRVAIVQPEKSIDNVKEEGGMYAKIKQGEAEGSAWCPKIYFNHKCFSGPYLSKARIAELPKCVGPGPINLVMKEVLTMLISVAYKSCRVLRELQMEGPANPNMHQQVLKAKYKTKSYRAVVEICKTNSQLEDFCRQACIKLECCPNLISPHFIDDLCPENCSQLTKTKYTYYYGKKKKKIGRPPGGHSNLENGQKKTGKKKKKMNLANRKTRQNSPDGENADDADDDKGSVDSDARTVDSTSTTGSRSKTQLKAVKASMRLKRKYIHHIPPPSDIRTRGDKRPRYSFERRTHKKIMISSPYMTSQKSKSQPSKPSHSHSYQHSHSHNHSHGQQPTHQHYQKKDGYHHSNIKKEDILKLDKNPLEWTITNVVDFIKTTDCAIFSRLFKEQEIDGQALLLLTLPTVQEHLGLKLGPAIKLCHHIERVKIAFYETFAK